MNFVHVMIRVLDFEATQRFYGLLGFREVDRYSFPEFEVSYLACKGAATQLELVRNIGRDAPYSHGESFGNLSFSTPDVEVLWRLLHLRGFEPEPVKELLHASGELFARYFFVADPDGYRVEILDMVGRWNRFPALTSLGHQVKQQ